MKYASQYNKFYLGFIEMGCSASSDKASKPKHKDKDKDKDKKGMCLVLFRVLNYLYREGT